MAAQGAQNSQRVKRVLLIAFFFPPRGGGGVQRTVKFVKYLYEFGWQPTILTAPTTIPVRDPSMEAEVPSQTAIVRVRGLTLPDCLPWRFRRWVTHWVLTVDEQVGWLPFAVREGSALLGQGGWQALYSTSTPYTDHLVAMRLKRESQLPWVADFRDPWLDNFAAAFATPVHRSFCARLERNIVFAADRVLVISEPMRQQFLRRYPELPPAHVITLPNGFDPADFELVKPAARDSRFTLVYAGSLYGSRTARPFLTALRQLLDDQTIPRDMLCVRFVGSPGYETAQLVTEWALNDVVELVGYLPHTESIAQQLSADALLLIIAGGANSEAVFTAKIFEYLAAAKPILALIPPGTAADLLTEAFGVEALAGALCIVPPDDPAAIATALVTQITAWREGRLQGSPDPAVIGRYDRRRQTGELARILDELLDEQRT